MKGKIREILKKVEEEKDIEILFAVEGGSRVWGFESTDSDYDVRFVYKKHLREYLKARRPKDGHMEKVVDDVDMVGFDLLKFTGLLVKSNPNMIEWVISSILYYGEIHPKFIFYARNCFNPVALYHHYKSLSKYNYNKYIKSDNKVTTKKYLYVMRGIFNAEWVSVTGGLPVLNFKEAVEKHDWVLFGHLNETIQGLIAKKIFGVENEIIPRVKSLDVYIENFLESEQTVTHRKIGESILDSAVWDLLEIHK